MHLLDWATLVCFPEKGSCHFKGFRPDFCLDSAFHLLILLQCYSWPNCAHAQLCLAKVYRSSFIWNMHKCRMNFFWLILADIEHHISYVRLTFFFSSSFAEVMSFFFLLIFSSFNLMLDDEFLAQTGLRLKLRCIKILRCCILYGPLYVVIMIISKIWFARDSF